MTTEKVKWAMEADYFQACNCDYGCPCEYQAPPTQGKCDGVGAWRINQGRYGDISLDGLGFGFAARWPGAVYKGNGTGIILIDERADQPQRKALWKIASGQAGGMPFEVFPVPLFSKVLETLYMPFQFDVKGKNSSLTIGDAVAMAFEPIKNLVTGEPESICIEHETGFVFKGAEVVSAKECRVSVGELNFSYPEKCGFVTQVKYGN